MRRGLVVLPVLVVFVLAGCVPPPGPPPSPAVSTSATATAIPTTTATPDATALPPSTTSPTDPELVLTLTAIGVGAIRVGEWAGTSGLLQSRTEDCADGGAGTGPFVEIWSVTDPESVGSIVFRTDEAGMIRSFQVIDPRITTVEGVGLGSPLADVLELEGLQEGASSGPWLRYLIPGDPGTIILDVAVDDPRYWGEDANRVQQLGITSVEPAAISGPSFHGQGQNSCL